MSNVVALLEQIGQNSRLKRLTEQQLAEELSLSGLTPAVQTALVEQRSKRLEELLGASSNVCCLIHAPQDEQPEEEDAPQKDKSARSQGAQMEQRSPRRAAIAR